MTRYYPVNESIEFRGKPAAELIDLKITLNGIECAFGRKKGDKAWYAAYTDIPRTQTSYNKENHQFIITFVNTDVSEHVKNFDAEFKIENIFLDSVELKEEGSDCKVLVNLKDGARYYTGKQNWLGPSQGTPFAKFIFISESEYNDYVMMEL